MKVSLASKQQEQTAQIRTMLKLDDDQQETDGAYVLSSFLLDRDYDAEDAHGLLQRN